MRSGMSSASNGRGTTASLHAGPSRTLTASSLTLAIPHNTGNETRLTSRIDLSRYSATRLRSSWMLANAATATLLIRKAILCTGSDATCIETE